MPLAVAYRALSPDEDPVATEALEREPTFVGSVGLIGSEDSGGKAWANPAMYSLLQPFDYLHGAFYANAACLDTRSGNVDRSYVARLLALHDDMRHGVRPILRGTKTVDTAAGLSRGLRAPRVEQQQAG